jgi:hypothetical protein
MQAIILLVHVDGLPWEQAGLTCQSHGGKWNAHMCVCDIYIYIFVCWICLFKFIIHSESIGYMICVNTDT